MIRATFSVVRPQGPEKVAQSKDSAAFSVFGIQMQYDELRHTQLLRWNCSKVCVSSQRHFLKRLQAKRRRFWDKKLVEIEMDTFRESYRSPETPYIMERVRDSGSPSRL
jgi:hypothetical protein